MDENTNAHHGGTVEINATDYPYHGETITLADIQRLATIPADHQVYVEIPEPTDDPQLTAGEVVEVREHGKFYSVSPAITGGAR